MRSVQGDVSSSLDEWCARLDSAKAGGSEAIGELLDEVRSYLTALTQNELDSDLRGKEGISDLVQSTLMEAARDFAEFRGRSEAEFRAWLRNILLNNLRDLLGKYLTQKRDVGREQRLDGQAGLAESLAAADDSPSQAAVRKEKVTQVLAALDKLSAEQRDILRLRHEEQLTFGQIGERLGINEAAAQKRWARTVEELRGLLGE
jgi:RNA polymerase sigma-70 factor (ECF subfamily)